MGLPGRVPPCGADALEQSVENRRRQVAFLRGELEKPLSPARRRMVLQALREAEQACGEVMP